MPPRRRRTIGWNFCGTSRARVARYTDSLFGSCRDEPFGTCAHLRHDADRIDGRHGDRRLLTIGALTVFTQGQSAYRANESIARLQERARLALPPLETDLRMAGYFGLTTRSSDIANRASPARPTTANLAVGNDCANNWSIHLDAAVAGTNNGFAWAGCAPYRQAQPGADTLVVRRASAGSTPPDDLSRGMLYVNTARFGAGYILRRRRSGCRISRRPPCHGPTN